MPLPLRGFPYFPHRCPGLIDCAICRWLRTRKDRYVHERERRQRGQAFRY